MSLDPYKRKRCRSTAPTAFFVYRLPWAGIKRETLIPPLQINFCYRNCYTNSSIAGSVAVIAISGPHMSSLRKRSALREAETYLLFCYFEEKIKDSVMLINSLNE